MPGIRADTKDLAGGECKTIVMPMTSHFAVWPNRLTFENTL
jgi:hypothetical protein